jgi:hypothetical protein
MLCEDFFTGAILTRMIFVPTKKCTGDDR